MEIIDKYSTLGKIYSIEIKKINKMIFEDNGENLKKNMPFIIPFDHIFYLNGGYSGKDCINIAELLRNKGWTVVLIDELMNNIENFITDKTFIQSKAGWKIC